MVWSSKNDNWWNGVNRGSVFCPSAVSIRFAPVIKGDLLGVISVSDILHKGNAVEKPHSLDLEVVMIKRKI
ncbi:CP12 polypeptide [Microcystis aeruginosa NIES-3787]|uniref:CP12 polypeptide n=1 Tax=Microcystis aeruginosa NIES-3787 TaxID=2517782 RepID=A0A6H9GEM4_MICAE|nr:CP12 polypeptide [Microcystis aeruginosa NIES-3787]